MAVVMGVLPNLFLRPIGPSVERLLNQIHQGAQTPVRALGPHRLPFDPAIQPRSEAVRLPASSLGGGPR